AFVSREAVERWLAQKEQSGPLQRSEGGSGVICFRRSYPDLLPPPLLAAGGHSRRPSPSDGEARASRSSPCSANRVGLGQFTITQLMKSWSGRQNPLLTLDLNGSAVVIGGAGNYHEVSTRVVGLATH